MNKNYCSWSDEEIIRLFLFVETGKKTAKSLVKIFEEFARQSGRKTNSVRNYYYAEINELTTNSKKRERLKIDLSKHQKMTQKPFSETEEEKLVLDVIKLYSLGHSVRSACLKLGKGDLQESIRHQNKFRNILKNNPNVVTQCEDKLRSQGFVVRELSQKQQTNLVIMPKKQTVLSDQDIEALFLGLVKIVKKTALARAEESHKNELCFANDSLRKTLVKLANKESRVKELSILNKRLKEENDRLSGKLEILRAQALSGNLRPQKNERVSKLEKFLNTLPKEKKMKMKAKI